MKTKSVYVSMILVLACWSGLAMGAGEPTVDGVFGLSRVPTNSFVAVWVPAAAGSMVEGVRWFHNDGQTEIPEILAAAGSVEWPGTVLGSVSLKSEVVAQSSSWNEVQFEQPLVSETGGLYIIFRLPAGSVFDHSGCGGGFGLGYYAGDGVRRGWLSGDGETWNPIRPDYQIAVEAIQTASKALGAPLVLHMASDSAPKFEADGKHPEPELAVSPNPFNPSTEIRFTLPVGGWADVVIFDIRGYRVLDLAGEYFNRGEHRVVWDGRNSDGQRAASGVYFARLTSGEFVLSQRLVMLK